jgi:hypothetical protein
MKFFQIRFFRDKSGSFKYFEADADYEKKAIEVANEHHERKLELCDGFLHRYDPIKTITVVEYDKVRKKAVIKGIKFKLRLTFIEATFYFTYIPVNYNSGKKVKNTWYELKD